MEERCIRCQCCFVGSTGCHSCCDYCLDTITGNLKYNIRIIEEIKCNKIIYCVDSPSIDIIPYIKYEYYYIEVCQKTNLILSV